jgi:hypothetical protein
MRKIQRIKWIHKFKAVVILTLLGIASMLASAGSCVYAYLTHQPIENHNLIPFYFGAAAFCAALFIELWWYLYEKRKWYLQDRRNK